MQSVNWRSTQFKLASWFDCYALAIQHSADDVFPFHDGVPPEAATQPLQERFDAVVVNASVVREVVPKLLMLCAKPTMQQQFCKHCSSRVVVAHQSWVRCCNLKASDNVSQASSSERSFPSR